MNLRDVSSVVRDARAIASPHAKTDDDPAPGRRDIAGRYDRLLERMAA